MASITIQSGPNKGKTIPIPDGATKEQMDAIAAEAEQAQPGYGEAALNKVMEVIGPVTKPVGEAYKSARETAIGPEEGQAQWSRKVVETLLPPTLGGAAGAVATLPFGGPIPKAVAAGAVTGLTDLATGEPTGNALLDAIASAGGAVVGMGATKGKQVVQQNLRTGSQRAADKAAVGAVVGGENPYSELLSGGMLQRAKAGMESAEQALKAVAPTEAAESLNKIKLLRQDYRSLMAAGKGSEAHEVKVMADAIEGRMGNILKSLDPNGAQLMTDWSEQSANFAKQEALRKFARTAPEAFHQGPGGAAPNTEALVRKLAKPAPGGGRSWEEYLLDTGNADFIKTIRRGAEPGAADVTTTVGLVPAIGGISSSGGSKLRLGSQGVPVPITRHAGKGVVPPPNMDSSAFWGALMSKMGFKFPQDDGR